MIISLFERVKRFQNGFEIWIRKSKKFKSKRVGGFGYYATLVLIINNIFNFPTLTPSSIPTLILINSISKPQPQPANSIIQAIHYHLPASTYLQSSPIQSLYHSHIIPFYCIIFTLILIPISIISLIIAHIQAWTTTIIHIYQSHSPYSNPHIILNYHLITQSLFNYIHFICSLTCR